MLFMPIIVWIAFGSLRRVALSVALFACVLNLYPMFSEGAAFILGALMYRLEFHNRVLQSKAPQWLGKISYSLYLSHWLILTLAWRAFGPEVGGMIAFPIALAVGWLVWWAVERPSVWASRRIGWAAEGMERTNAVIAETEVASP